MRYQSCELPRTRRAAQLVGCFRLIASHLILAASITGCERPPEAPLGRAGLRAHVALIGLTQFDAAWPALQGGFRSGLQPYAEITVETVAPSERGQAALLRCAEDVLTRRPRVVCVVTSDPALALPALLRCAQAGALVITIGAATGESCVFGHVEVEWSGGAERLGDNLEKLAGESRTFLLLHENERNTVATYCYRRFSAAARRQFEMRLLEERSTVGELATPADIVHAMTARYPGAGLVVTLLPDPWLTAPPGATIASSARFATLGASPALWPALRSGRAAALVGPLDGEVGRRAAEIALEALVGGENDRSPRVVKCELVTAETLEDFAKRYSAAAAMQFETPASQQR